MVSLGWDSFFRAKIFQVLLSFLLLKGHSMLLQRKTGGESCGCLIKECILAKRKSGNESCNDAKKVSYRVLDFWQYLLISIVI